jgi:hypothetical protein
MTLKIAQHQNEIMIKINVKGNSGKRLRLKMMKILEYVFISYPFRIQLNFFALMADLIPVQKTDTFFSKSACALSH